MGSPKSGVSRDVDISADLAATLKAHIAERKEEGLRRGPDAEEWLFVNREGHALDDKRVRVVFRRVGLVQKDDRGRNVYTPYSMRHTFATLLLQQGVPISYVSEQLGHESIETTLRWYWWALPRGEVGYLDELDHAIDSATNCNQNAPKGSRGGAERRVSAREYGADGQTRTDDLLSTNRFTTYVLTEARWATVPINIL